MVFNEKNNDALISAATAIVFFKLQLSCAVNFIKEKIIFFESCTNWFSLCNSRLANVLC